ncbi:hypothetical protein [Crossiella sp. CA198]|uniref:hypothetical protein n=1 Tax=Crossiella sp. CA198 TaxID=3455607 RepID=UPI003F8CF41B
MRETAETARQVLSSTRYSAGALIRTSEDRYGSVSVEVDDPSITSGESACPRAATRCETRRVDGGTVVITDNTADNGLILAEFYRPDSTQPIRIRVAQLVTNANSVFWSGGGRADRPTLDADGIGRLAVALNSAQ